MSISFNHPKNTMTSTDTLDLIVLGGTPSSPRPIRLSASSVIVPVRGLPIGEIGSLVLDNSSKTLKYHDGTSWIEIQSSDAILEPIRISLTDIYNRLNTKIDTVSYSSSSVPGASISGTNLNIVFPLSSSSGSGPTGLYTSLKPGCITQYSLTSGMNVNQIREQMSGIAGGQNGRTGTQSNPYVTSDGWCLGDGMWWKWSGENGDVIKLVPNLCKEAYLRGIDVNGLTKIDNVIVGSADIGGTALTVGQIPPLQFTVSGQTGVAGNHTHTQKTLGNDRPGANALTSSDARWAGYTIDNIQEAGNHIHTFTGTTNILGSGQTHTHSIRNIDVDHFNVAYLYNIAESNVALSEKVANSRYVLKAGDVMTGSLTIASSATVRGDDNSLVLYFRNSSNGERAAIYHSTATNTLRLRSAGGTEVTISQAGMLYSLNMNAGNNITSASSTVTSNTSTVGGRNVVRAVNGYAADGNGNVSIPTSLGGVRLGSAVWLGQGGWMGNYGGNYRGYVMTAYESYSKSRHYAAEIRAIQIQVDGIWYNVTQV